MLPAYVNRTFEDRECVREIVKTADTASEALDALAATLDPPIDQYSSRQALCRLTWQPGESIDHLYFKAKRLAAEAGVDLKFVASLIASQLPRDVESKIKGTVVEIDSDLEGAASRKLLTDIKRLLNDHGHALDKGSLDIEQIVKVASLSAQPSTEPPVSDGEEELDAPGRTITYTQQDEIGEVEHTKQCHNNARRHVRYVAKTISGATAQRNAALSVVERDTVSAIAKERSSVGPRVVSCKFPTASPPNYLFYF